jgi:spore maturation protein SpmB
MLHAIARSHPTRKSFSLLAVRSKVWGAIKQGIRKGLRTALWLLKFMVPVSLGVTLLAWSGWLEWLGRHVAALFQAFGLPGQSAIAYLSAVLLNNYSGIGAMGLIALTHRQVTILAMMMLICHNLPLEATIQHKVGTSGPRMALLRIGMSLLGGLLLNWILPASSERAHAMAAVSEIPLGLLPTLGAWAVSISWLAGKLALILMGLMILQQFLQDLGLIPWIARLIAPVLWLLGLPRNTAFLWIVANTLGLSFGAAVIISEVESGALSDEEVDLLNHSIAVSHSLLEDTLLFVAIGASAFWITIPRLALAAGAVWGFRAWRRLRA